MLIEELINSINDLLTRFESIGLPEPASPGEIETFKKSVFTNLNYALPSAFEKLLTCSNGVLFNGLTIWPTKKYWMFKESFIEANMHLRESFNDKTIYLGTRDEELYIFNTEMKQYQAIEYVGEARWETFKDAEKMILFMLARALE